jgi:membrane associated rhomboid family serine protease
MKYHMPRQDKPKLWECSVDKLSICNDNKFVDEMFNIIEAQTRRQALDWALVLASQNIDAVIERNAEGKYVLIVPKHDYLRAIEQINLYQTENSHRRHPFQVEVAHSLFDWRGVIWAIVITLFYLVCENSNIDFRAAGMMHKDAVLHGEWWRLFTAVSLHADLPHLASNATAGLVLLGVAMVYYGAGLALFLSFLSGVGGNILGILLHHGDYYGLGASGMVMGSLGLLAATGWFAETPVSDRHNLLFKMRRLIAALFLFILLGLNPKSDIQAHIGGFLFGWILGAGFLRILNKPSKYTFLNQLGAVATIVIILFAWGIALR